MQKKYALFDFDGTLCKGDSIVPFCRYARKQRYATRRQLLAGIGAAMLVKGQQKAEVPLETKAGAGVRYVLPQTIHSRDADVSLFLRVTKPFGAVKFTVTAGDKVLKTVKHLKAAPGEMEKITLKADALKDVKETISVSLEEL